MNTTMIHVHHISMAAPAEVIDEVVAFYDTVLGLKPGWRPDFGAIRGYWLYAGEHPLIHLVEDAERRPGTAGYFDHVALRCQDLEGIRARLQTFGIAHREFDNPALKQRLIFVTDPAGTLLELNFSTA